MTDPFNRYRVRAVAAYMQDECTCQMCALLAMRFKPGREFELRDTEPSKPVTDDTLEKFRDGVSEELKKWMGGMYGV